MVNEQAVRILLECILVFTGVCWSTGGRGSLSRGGLCSGGVSVWGWSLSKGGLCPGGGSLCPMERRSLSGGGGLCLGGGGLCPGRGGLCPGRSLRDLCPGGSLGVCVQGGSLSGGSVSGRPPIW